MSTARYKLTVSYDGTGYAGWQVQPAGRTVQAVIECALNEITGKKIKIHGSGRTDSGVHARGQVAHFDADIKMLVSKIPIVINGMIPSDIRVLSAGKVDPEFHARRQAVAKEYRYFIWNKPLMDPFERLYHHHVRRPLDLRAMRCAAKSFVGKHDFRAFCATSRKQIDNYVRDVSHVRVKEVDGVVCIAVKGQGFLYKMVRGMAGYLIRVGLGEAAPDSVGDVLKSKTRTAQVPTAPAAGLFLWKVWY